MVSLGYGEVTCQLTCYIDAVLGSNERQVGQAIRASGIPRSEIYITTKLAYVMNMALHLISLIPL
jgi:aryl-alcohol dehydrogenase-like predicted oxidoreductase